MHVHDAPGCEDRFLVGVLEVAEYPRDLLDAARGRQLVRALGELSYLGSRLRKHVRVVVFNELLKDRLRDALRHELSPRLVVHKGRELLDRNDLLNRHVCAVDEKRHADRDCAEDEDCVLLLLAAAFHLFAGGAFLFGEFAAVTRDA